jgi:hypothetical protein
VNAELYGRKADPRIARLQLAENDIKASFGSDRGLQRGDHLSRHSLLYAVPGAAKTAAIADLMRLVYRSPSTGKKMGGRPSKNAQTFRRRGVPSRSLRLQRYPAKSG